MSDARFELLKAMRAAIRADGALRAMISGVFDPPTRGAAHPFVTIGDIKSAPLDGDQPPTLEHLVEVWVYSRTPARAEASDIADRLRALFDGAALNLDGHDLISLRHRDSDVSPVRDRRGFRARVRLRAVTASNI